MLEKLRAQLATLLDERAAHVKTRDDIVAAAETEQRADLTADETSKVTEARSAVKAIDEKADALRTRIDELDAEQRADAAAAESRKALGLSVVGHARVTEPEVYRRGGSNSWFSDLASVTRGHNPAAIDRLSRGSAQAAEQRAVDINTTAGSGGEFAPPLWLVEDFVKLQRAGRVFADLVGPRNLPSGVSSINLPKISGGTATATQTTQGNAVQDTALTTTSVTSGIRTIAGKQTISLQELSQAGVNMDEVILQDLAADYAVQFDTQVLSSNDSIYKGVLNVASIGAVTYTDASPAVAGAGKYYAQLAKAIQTVSTARYMPPTAIVMHPRRWAWVAASFDSNNRPLIVPSGAGINVVGAQDGAPVAQGSVGQILGLPVYTDPNVPTNLGGGTNQDPTLVLRVEDLFLYESALQTASFDATYADSLQVLLRVHAFSAFIGGRYPSSICTVNGTGTITPVF